MTAPARSRQSDGEAGFDQAGVDLDTGSFEDLLIWQVDFDLAALSRTCALQLATGGGATEFPCKVGSQSPTAARPVVGAHWIGTSLCINANSHPAGRCEGITLNVIDNQAEVTE